jgi:hypothetical protein
MLKGLQVTEEAKLISRALQIEKRKHEIEEASHKLAKRNQLSS